jgi:hypothetical protein
VYIVLKNSVLAVLFLNDLLKMRIGLQNLLFSPDRSGNPVGGRFGFPTANRLQRRAGSDLMKR